MNDLKTYPQDARKVFKKLGTCSRTFFYLLNREFDHLKEPEEKAADPLCGGIMQKGHQCGMVLGATMAVGAESLRRSETSAQAISLAISATQNLMESFSKRTGSVNCRDITDTDFSKKWDMIKFMLFKSRSCFKLADKWAPEAIQAASEGLSADQKDLPEDAISCASEVAKKMGGSEEEIHMVAGFAGGLGLSGGGCGALSAAIWMNTLAWARENPGKTPFSNPDAKKTLEIFTEARGGEMKCSEICGQHFKSVEEHTEFIKTGGCEELIELLAGTGT